MKANKKEAFQMPRKDTWFALLICLLGAALMVLSFFEV
jgi:hypothetical protein